MTIYHWELTIEYRVCLQHHFLFLRSNNWDNFKDCLGLAINMTFGTCVPHSLTHSLTMGVGRAELWGGGVQAAKDSSRGWVWEGV